MCVRVRVRVRGESVQAALMSNQPHKLRKTLNLFNEACSTGGVTREGAGRGGTGTGTGTGSVGVCATSVFAS